MIQNSTSQKIVNANLIVRLNRPNDEQVQMRPTIEAHAELLYACDYFNEKLFNNQLPDFVITYIRKKNVPSHFCPDRFQRGEDEFWPELSFNPIHLAMRSQRHSLSTITYELTRLARHTFAPKNRRGGQGSNGYHDKPWAVLMERIGLMPSNTGLPGGKKTGSHMSYFIIEHGPFDRACGKLLDSGFKINWHDRLIFQNVAADGSYDDDAPPAKKRDRVKFTCENCHLNAWAKPNAILKCGKCDLLMNSDATALPLTSTH